MKLNWLRLILLGILGGCFGQEETSKSSLKASSSSSSSPQPLNNFSNQSCTNEELLDDLRVCQSYLSAANSKLQNLLNQIASLDKNRVENELSSFSLSLDYGGVVQADSTINCNFENATGQSFQMAQSPALSLNMNSSQINAYFDSIEGKYKC